MARPATRTVRLLSDDEPASAPVLKLAADLPEIGEVETGIEYPGRPGRALTPLTEAIVALQVGQSRVISRVKLKSVVTAMARARKANGGTYRMRAIDGGARVWRIA